MRFCFVSNGHDEIWLTHHIQRHFSLRQTDVERDDEKSIRSFDWIGYTNALQIHKNGAIESFPTPFLSIPGKSQNSPCKVMMYKFLGRWRISLFKLRNLT